MRKRGRTSEGERERERGGGLGIRRDNEKGSNREFSKVKIKISL